MNFNKSSFGIFLIYLLVVAGSLLFLLPFNALGYVSPYGITPTSNPLGTPITMALVSPAAYILGIVLIETAVLLLMIYLKLFDKIIPSIFFLILSYAYALFTFIVINYLWPYADATTAALASLAIGVISTSILYKFPKWYIIDIFGIIMCIEVVVDIGKTLSIVPLIILLIAIAIYDYIAVFKTKHMCTLAETLVNLKLPTALFIVPRKSGYSYEDSEPINVSAPTERAAYMIGMGDIVFPLTLAFSACSFTTFGSVLFGLNIPAIFTIIGILCGLVALMYFVNKGNVQPGLPLLNGGAIIGLLIGLAIVGGV